MDYNSILQGVFALSQEDAEIRKQNAALNKEVAEVRERERQLLEKRIQDLEKSGSSSSISKAKEKPKVKKAKQKPKAKKKSVKVVSVRSDYTKEGKLRKKPGPVQSVIGRYDQQKPGLEYKPPVRRKPTSLELLKAEQLGIPNFKTFIVVEYYRRNGEHYLCFERPARGRRKKQHFRGWKAMAKVVGTNPKPPSKLTVPHNVGNTASIPISSSSALQHTTVTTLQPSISQLTEDLNKRLGKEIPPKQNVRHARMYI